MQSLRSNVRKASKISYSLYALYSYLWFEQCKNIFKEQNFKRGEVLPFLGIEPTTFTGSPEHRWSKPEGRGFNSHPGGRFSKVPKLYRPFSGVIIPFVTQEWRAFNSSTFTVIFLFVTLKTYEKIGFLKQAVGNFTDDFSGPKSFRDFRETGPWSEFSSLCGPNSISRANAHMVYGLKTSTSHYIPSLNLC